MSQTAIRAENLSKRYRIGGRKAAYRTLRESLIEGVHTSVSRFSSIIRGKASRIPGNEETIWALKEVSFEVNEGETLGIIGRNGAGKSTLLKILSRITKPTSGQVTLRGRVGSLLEVGTGFHPELTGRENIYLNGAILGMHRNEILRKFDEIVDFSEIEKFLDTPVKYYSSGMYMRLAFAVAAHLEPEILLVDEVLAVGDAAFQKKCLGKMGEIASEGRTVLFVSHNMVAVESLCDRGIWLNNGELAEYGSVNQVVSNYSRANMTNVVEKVWDDIETAPGNVQVKLHTARVRPPDQLGSDHISVRTPFILEFEYWNLQPNAYLNPSIHVQNEFGMTIFNTFPDHEPIWHGHPFPKGLFTSSCYIPGDLLNDGIHRVTLYMVKDQGVVLYRYDDILTFEIQDDFDRRGNWYGKWTGMVRPNLEWKTEFISPIVDTKSGKKTQKSK